MKQSFTPPFAVISGELTLGGMPLSRLAMRVGQTPFYAYDRGLLTRRMAELRAAMPEPLQIHYAMKANPMPALVQHMATLADGFDLASAGEMQVALDTTMPPERISMAGPGKRPEELAQAIAAGITINLESEHELATVAGLAESLGITPKVAIRINPAFELKASGMKMGGGAKPFGVDEERVPAMLASIKTLGLAFQGFHIYSGSQNLKPEAIIEAQRQTVDLVRGLRAVWPEPIAHVNLGGGFGIPYFPGDRPLALAPIGEALSETLASAKQDLPETEFIIEPGRYLVGEAGIYVSKVIDKKISRGAVFLVVDGGLHHHLAASGNFGQVIRKNYPVALGCKLDQPPQQTVNIVGPLCTPLDILAERIELPEAEIGDLVVVFQSGAYGLSASPTAFLNQPRALEVLV
ncbi:MAG: pyridoxal-dependent decarboxylase, exosortase A system-associated [Methylococcales bacterium]|nr:pyridoxal-dependent decarboxylase, exosortase A system-associated [Methylococcales bacterium]